MPSGADYFWNAYDSDNCLVQGAAASFGTASMISSNDGYGGTNWSFASSSIVVHVHFRGASRQVSVVRIKTCEGASLDANIIKLGAGATKGLSLKNLAKYCGASFPNHKAMLDKLYAALPPAS